MPLAIGTILENRYRIDALLGSGGMGAVYRAWDQRLDRHMAIKENALATPESARQFEREAKMLARLRHPNLPGVSDHFVGPNGAQYLVMDYVEGEDLGQMLQRHGALEEAQAVAWIEQVSSALIYLHNQQPPVIHRDVKPGNVKITPQGEVYLVDFGIAKVGDAQAKTTMGALGVTPGFSPPEQYGQGGTDARSDVYALGATLYALLTGQTPPDSVQRAIRAAVLPPPRALRPDVGAAVAGAVEAALRTTPTDRPQTVAAFLAILRGEAPPPAPSRHEEPTELMDEARGRRQEAEGRPAAAALQQREVPAEPPAQAPAAQAEPSLAAEEQAEPPPAARSREPATPVAERRPAPREAKVPGAARAGPRPGAVPVPARKPAGETRVRDAAAEAQGRVAWQNYALLGWLGVVQGLSLPWVLVLPFVNNIAALDRGDLWLVTYRLLVFLLALWATQVIGSRWERLGRVPAIYYVIAGTALQVATAALVLTMNVAMEASGLLLLWASGAAIATAGAGFMSGAFSPDTRSWLGPLQGAGVCVGAWVPLALFRQIGWASQSIYVILGLAAAVLLLLALSLHRSPAVPADVASADLATVRATLRSPKASLLGIGGLLGVGLGAVVLYTSGVETFYLGLSSPLGSTAFLLGAGVAPFLVRRPLRGRWRSVILLASLLLATGGLLGVSFSRALVPLVASTAMAGLGMGGALAVLLDLLPLDGEKWLLWGCIGIGLALHALLSPYPIFSGRLTLQGTFRIGGIACLLALPLAWLFLRAEGQAISEKPLWRELLPESLRWPVVIIVAILVVVTIFLAATGGFWPAAEEPPVREVATEAPAVEPASSLDRLPTPVPELVTDAGTWTTFTNATDVYNLLFHDGLLWAATAGGLVVWDIEEGVHVKYTALDGLASNHVQGVVAGPDGGLWFATWRGINRYDPAAGTWQTFTETNSIGDGFVSSMAVGPDGALWFGVGDRGGVSRYDPKEGDWQSLAADKASDSAATRTTSIVLGPDSALWLGTDKGVRRYDLGNGTWQSFTSEDDLVDDRVDVAMTGPDGALWFGTREGVSRYEPTRDAWQTFTTADGLDSNRVIALATGPDGTLWFGTNVGLNRYDPARGTWQTFSEAEGLPFHHMYAAVAGPDGALWFGTNRGIARFDGQSWKTYTTPGGPYNNWVGTVAVADDGTAWFGSFNMGGCAQFDGQTWTTYGGEDLQYGYEVDAITIVPDGAVWVAGYGGVAVFDGDAWTAFTEEDGLAGREARGIALAPDGALWFATLDGGVSRFDGDRWTTYTTADGLADDQVLTIAVAADGALWFGTPGGGVSRYDGRTWTTYTAADGLADNSVSDIKVAPDGAIWFATIGGASRFDGLNWRTYTEQDGLINDFVRAIATAPDGALWFATSGGVSRLDGERWTSYTQADGLADDKVWDVDVDRNGTIWFATNVGISKYQPLP
jgi:ligand-binding sensor domain-containing protein